MPVPVGWCLGYGVDDLLGGLPSGEAACEALGAEDAGAVTDAELRCFRFGQPDAVGEADLVMRGEVHRDRPADAAGGCAETAGDGGPDGPALAAEGGQRVLQRGGGRSAGDGEEFCCLACPGGELVVLPAVVVPLAPDAEPRVERAEQGAGGDRVGAGEAAEERGQGLPADRGQWDGQRERAGAV